ncbi:MAG: biopolymer transporter ExbD [Deltaproteobacteria bacterium]|nr:biopolymer transporter ExbD [Deltaproteobacteria bacterium]
MAGSAPAGDGDEVISAINVTPLVDIMLCLLVIFMVTTSYVVADSLKVDLPEASTGDSTEPSVVMITFTVEKDTGVRQLYLNGEKSDETKLRAHIQKVKAEGKKDLQAVIAADKTASHGEVIHLIDVVKQEGIVKFALNIESGG